mmetsp:Transcript_72965/g.206378  ORF Transcript_72965/g.206378 Transcript_72965/m.206378 type:complete len:309 (-) Transcript_72965:392-1318(-)
MAQLPVRRRDGDVRRGGPAGGAALRQVRPPRRGERRRPPDGPRPLRVLPVDVHVRLGVRLRRLHELRPGHVLRRVRAVGRQVVPVVEDRHDRRHRRLRLRPEPRLPLPDTGEPHRPRRAPAGDAVLRGRLHPHHGLRGPGPGEPPHGRPVAAAQEDHVPRAQHGQDHPRGDQLHLQGGPADEDAVAVLAAVLHRGRRRRHGDRRGEQHGGAGAGAERPHGPGRALGRQLRRPAHRRPRERLHRPAGHAPLLLHVPRADDVGPAADPDRLRSLRAGRRGPARAELRRQPLPVVDRDEVLLRHKVLRLDL